MSEGSEDMHEDGVPYEFLLVSSDKKAQEHQSYRDVRNHLLDQRTPNSTAGDLKTIHRILTTSSACHQLPRPVREEMEDSLYMLDRSDGDERFEQFRPILAEMCEEGEKDLWPPGLFVVRAQWAFRDLCKPGTSISLDPKLSGELRSYGTRKIDGHPEERVFASHTVEYGGMMYGIMKAQGYPFNPPSFYGISVGLDKVYERLCARYDALRAEAKDLDQRVLAEAFLQLVGTRVVHPFWDGNGRTFATLLDLSLAEQGIDLGGYENLQDLTAGLSGPNDEFLMGVLKQAKLGLVQEMQHLHIKIGPALRANYMERLGKAVDLAIDEGVDPSGRYFKFYRQAASTIKSAIDGV